MQLARLLPVHHALCKRAGSGELAKSGQEQLGLVGLSVVVRLFTP